ncbi:UNVERIFIED_CONTAM: hypothetical protein GTU68_016741 [Idotea baltica]|nr:hypothetical protein [Idotea baltica]
MDGAIANLRTEFASLRTGRASASMLEPVMVDAYGSMTPINQVGTVNVPEPRMVTVNVWDKGLVGKVEKAIRESGLGINPQLNGTIIMLPIPELNEERRRELTKVAGTYAENAPSWSIASAPPTASWTKSKSQNRRIAEMAYQSAGETKVSRNFDK